MDYQYDDSIELKIIERSALDAQQKLIARILWSIRGFARSNPEAIPTKPIQDWDIFELMRVVDRMSKP